MFHYRILYNVIALAMLIFALSLLVFEIRTQWHVNPKAAVIVGAVLIWGADLLAKTKHNGQ